MLSWLKRKKEDPKQALKSMLGDFELPTFPKVVMEALELLRSPDASLAEISQKISADPGTSARILSVANSAAYALRNSVRSVEHAASLLGRNELEALLLSAAVGKVLPKKKVPGYDPVEFWTAAARRAAIARALAREVDPSRRGDCFTAALLGDMAMPLMLEAKGEVYRKILDAWREDGEDLVALEQESFGFHHTLAAGYMCETWKFPEQLITAIGGHHDQSEQGTTGGLECVRIAFLLREGTDDADEVVEMGSQILGMPSDQLVKVVEEAFEDADDIRRQFSA